MYRYITIVVLIDRTRSFVEGDYNLSWRKDVYIIHNWRNANHQTTMALQYGVFYFNSQ